MMKTVTGKEFRKLFNRRESGFYLSEFRYLRECDPLFPECAGRELKPGYKVKVDVWNLEDAELYSEYIATKEIMTKSMFMMEIERIWFRVYPAYIYGMEEKINIRAKGSESFKNETPQEKQAKLTLKLEELNELEQEISIISENFKTYQDFMHYFYMIFDIEREIKECEFFIHEASMVVKSVIECIDHFDKNKKSNCDEFYSESHDPIEDDQDNLFYLNESYAEGVNVEKQTRKKTELLYLSLESLHQRLVSKIKSDMARDVAPSGK